MCTILQLPGVNPFAVNKYIISYHIISYHIPYHNISYRIIYIISYRMYHIVSYHIIPYIITYRVIFYHIISYRIISYHHHHIISYTNERKISKFEDKWQKLKILLKWYVRYRCDFRLIQLCRFRRTFALVLLNTLDFGRNHSTSCTLFGQGVASRDLVIWGCIVHPTTLFRSVLVPRK